MQDIDKVSRAFKCYNEKDLIQFFLHLFNIISINILSNKLEHNSIIDNRITGILQFIY